MLDLQKQGQIAWRHHAGTIWEIHVLLIASDLKARDHCGSWFTAH